MNYREKPSLEEFRKGNIIFAEKPDSPKDLEHYGIKRRSGRYPWGSGENPFQHEGDFLTAVAKMRKEGFSWTDDQGKTWTGDTAIAKSLGLTTTEFRTAYAEAKEMERSEQVAMAKKLRDEGMSLQAIAKEMGFKNDSSVRSLLNEDSERRMNQARSTAEFLKEQVKEKGMIDVGSGVEKELNISQEKLKQALYILQAEDGYKVYGVGVPQVTNPGKQTNVTVLCPPGTEYKDAYNFGDIHSVGDYISSDDGQSFHKAFEYPSSMDSSRLQVVYGDQGGSNKDGLIEIRRGCKDLDLGDSNYAQVRILVDGTHYLKGMAMYSDDLPDGVDVRFNTNKPSGTPVISDDSKQTTVLKAIKTDDPDNPFGANLKEHGGQSYYDDPNGKYINSETGAHQSLSLINKTREEGDWTSWSDNLPAQFLSKQPMQLINQQLNLTEKNKQAEFDEICALTNPTIKKQLLSSFADDCDSAAVHLQAASLPRQKYQVILPIDDLKDNEVYAPNYRNGEQLALIRYPHGGTFEIPVVTVNNKQETAKNLLGNAIDAIGINSNVAARLSGADFDGDTVMVIPTNSKVKISSTKPLEGLVGFDPSVEYGGKEPGTFKAMKNTQNEMGRISNLITDMTLRGATDDELTRAVRHSMVVIDAEKHKLDYKQSEIDNDIAGLKRKYQGHTDKNGNYHEGVSTLISRAKSEQDVLKRQGTPKIDPDTGKLVYKEVEETYVGKDGKTHTRMQKSTKMAETDDAMTLLSEARTPQEIAYGNYANKMKSLANEARKEMVATKATPYSASAKETYASEVKSLDSKLNLALKNAPRERQAQTIANATVASMKASNPDMDNKEIKKASQRALAQARVQVGAKRTTVDITDKEWEAIQAGAVSPTKLSQIVQHTDTDALKQRATPKSNGQEISASKQNQIKAMASSGYTIAEIADRLGVARSTVSKYMK